MLLVFIHSYLKLVPRFFFFNFGHSIVQEQECEDPRTFFEAKGIREQKRFANTDLNHS